jgi:hypothetical protein
MMPRRQKIDISDDQIIAAASDADDGKAKVSYDAIASRLGLSSRSLRTIIVTRKLKDDPRWKAHWCCKENCRPSRGYFWAFGSK